MSPLASAMKTSICSTTKVGNARRKFVDRLKHPNNPLARSCLPLTTVWASHMASVMGRLVSSPSLNHAAGLGLLFVVDVTPPLHAIRQTERANLGCTWSRLRSAQHPHVRLYSIQRPCDGTSLSKSCRPSVIPPGPIGIRRRPQPTSCASENRCRQPTCDAARPPVCEPAPPSPASSHAASRRAAPMPLMSRTASLGSA